MSVITHDVMLTTNSISWSNDPRIDRLAVTTFGFEPENNYIQILERDTSNKSSAGGQLNVMGLVRIEMPATKVMYAPSAYGNDDCIAVSAKGYLAMYNLSEIPKGSFSNGSLYPEDGLAPCGAPAAKYYYDYIKPRSHLFSTKLSRVAVYTPQVPSWPHSGANMTSFDWRGNKAAMAYSCSILAMFDLVEGKEVFCANIHEDKPVYDVTWLDDTCMATAGGDGNVLMLDTRDLAESTILGSAASGCYTRITSNGDNLLACFGANDDVAVLYDRRKYDAPVSTCEGGHQGYINAAAFSEGAPRTIGTVGTDKTVNIWTIAQSDASKNNNSPAAAVSTTSSSSPPPPQPLSTCVTERFLTYDAPAPVNGLSWHVDTKCDATLMAISTGTCVQILTV